MAVVPIDNPTLYAVRGKSPREGYDIDRANKLFLFAHDVRSSHNRDKSVRLLRRRLESLRITRIVHVVM